MFGCVAIYYPVSCQFSISLALHFQYHKFFTKVILTLRIRNDREREEGGREGRREEGRGGREGREGGEGGREGWEKGVRFSCDRSTDVPN